MANTVNMNAPPLRLGITDFKLSRWFIVNVDPVLCVSTQSWVSIDRGDFTDVVQKLFQTLIVIMYAN
jgi:hypothetical protein